MSEEQQQLTNMSSREDAEFVRRHRRSRKSEPGDGSITRRAMLLVLQLSYAVFAYFYIRNYKTTLPQYQQAALIMFYGVYVLRTGVASFSLRTSLYFAWISLIMLGMVIFPMLTFPMFIFAEPFMECSFSRLQHPVPS